MFKTKIVNEVPETNPEDVLSLLNLVTLIDVRKPDEYVGELSHIEGAKLVTLGEDLTQFLINGDRSKPILFICKSGGRSGRATQEALELGYKCVANLTGGMMRWNELKYSVVK